MTETLLNKFPSYDECKDAVFQIKKKINLLALMVYQANFIPIFLSDFGPLFYAALQEIYDQEELTSTQNYL